MAREPIPSTANATWNNPLSTMIRNSSAMVKFGSPVADSTPVLTKFRTMAFTRKVGTLRGERMAAELAPISKAHTGTTIAEMRPAAIAWAVNFSPSGSNANSP